MKTRMKMKERVLGALFSSLLMSGCARALWNFKEEPPEGPDGKRYEPAREPVRPAVRVLCTGNSMVVRVRADLYGTGVRVRAHELRLGPRGAAGACTPELLSEEEEEEEHVITADLHECGAESREDTLVYSNTLFHSPTPNRLGISRSASAAVPLECRYRRTHFVSSNPQSPTPVPTFNLQLQTGDCTSDRSSVAIRPDDVINMAATVLGSHGAPLKLFVDRCVATERDALTTPAYDIINNHGCSADPASGVSFLPRTEDHVLRMQLNLPASIRGQRSSATSIYITCWMKTVHAAQEENMLNKACSYTGNGWRSVDGKHQVCKCCDGRCDVIGSRRKRRSYDGPGSAAAVLSVGPVVLLR